MDSKLNCFIDFDGTIVSNKQRLYNFFKDNIKIEFKNTLTIDEFWNLKRLGINEAEWINKVYSACIDIGLWNKLKAEKIETYEYLKYDELFEFSINSLKKLSKSYKLILVSRRDKKDNLLQELQELGLSSLFDDINILPHNILSKSTQLLGKYFITKEDLFIGDTEDDISSALKLNVTPVFVKSGIRSEWIINRYFSKYNNIEVINSIAEIDDIIKI